MQKRAWVNPESGFVSYNVGMQRLNSEMAGFPVVSLQSGDIVASVRRPVFNMSSLEIPAFLSDTPSGRRPRILVCRDIRRVSSDCLVIDSENDLTEPDEIIRLQTHLQANFSPQGKAVVTDTDRRLGSVDDCILDLDLFCVQKLYVRSSILRSWLGSSLTIDRSQIVDVTPKRITVRDAAVEARILPTESMPESPA